MMRSPSPSLRLRLERRPSPNENILQYARSCEYPIHEHNQSRYNKEVTRSNENLSAKNSTHMAVFDPHPTRPLFSAVMRGDLHGCQDAYSTAPKDIDAVYPADGKTALHIAAQMGHVEIVRWLIEKSANLDARDSKQRTPLFDAVKPSTRPSRWQDSRRPSGTGLEIVGILLDAGADASFVDEDGKTALEVALTTGYTDPRIVRRLAKNDDRTLFQLISYCGRESKLRDDNVMTTLKLIDAGIDLNIRRPHGESIGETPLILAARKGCLVVLQALIDRGANVELAMLDSSQKRPLHCAVLAGWSDCVQYLVNKGKADLEATSDGKTPLHHAAVSGNDIIVRFLIEKGANIMALSGDGFTASYLACVNRHDDVARLLLTHMTDEQALTITRPHSPPLLWVAASKECTKVAEHLIGISTRLGLSEKILSEKLGHPKRAIGYEAVMAGSHEMARLLLSHNASFDGVDKKQNGAIHYIALHGFDDILGDLLQKQPELQPQIKQQNDEQKYPIELAVMNNRQNVVKLLLHYEHPNRDEPTGPDINAWTALDWIAYYGRLDLARLITTPENIKSLVTGLWPSRQSAFDIAQKYHPENLELLECMRPGEVKISELDYSVVDWPWEKPVLVDDEAKSICQNIRGAILDTYEDKNIQTHEYSLYEIIYQYGPQRIMSAIKNARGIDGVPKFRWIHLPANNVNWLNDLTQRVYFDKHSNTGDISDLKQAHAHLQDFIDQNLSRQPESYAVEPLFARTRLSGSQDWSLLISIPYLSLCTVDNYDEQQRIRKHEVGNAQADLPAQGGRGQEDDRIKWSKKMMRFYTKKGQPFPCSLSLDKFHYSPLPSSHVRNIDQVLFRYQDPDFKSPMGSVGGRSTERGDRLLCVVDQLWVCVIDSDTIITAFPQSWYSGSMDLYKIIVDHFFEETKLRLQVSSLWEMIPLITTVAVSASTWWRSHIVKDGETVFDAFGASIWSVGDQEVQLQDDFTEQIESEYSKSNDEASMHMIIHEMELLKEIKDIEDELGIIQELATKQSNVLGKLMDFLKGTCELQGKFNIQRISSWYSSRISLDMQNHEISRMLHAAEQVHENINHLLDIRQKQANLGEAVSSRKTSVAAANQGNTVLFFTIMTISFLPVTILLSLLALNITSLPHNAAGQLSYSPRWIFKVLILATLSVSIPLIISAFYINEDVDGFVTKLIRIIFNRSPKNGQKSEATSEEEGVENESQVSKLHIPRRRCRPQPPGSV